MYHIALGVFGPLLDNFMIWWSTSVVLRQLARKFSQEPLPEQVFLPGPPTIDFPVSVDGFVILELNLVRPV